MLGKKGYVVVVVVLHERDSWMFAKLEKLYSGSGMLVFADFIMFLIVSHSLMRIKELA